MMVLYKLPFAVFPIVNIYARNTEDIIGWMSWFQQQDIEVIGSKGRFPAGIESLVQVDKGELKFDFGGIVSGKEYAEIDITEDFTVKVRTESVPYFRSYQSRLKTIKVGDLYGVREYFGSFNAMSYVPLDVFSALRDCDLSSSESAGAEHIKKLNRALDGLRTESNFHVFPKPRTRKAFN
ncbi:MAG: hypothetical protein AABX05_03185 [Nanoarchaeota archaeon]